MPEEDEANPVSPDNAAEGSVQAPSESLPGWLWWLLVVPLSLVLILLRYGFGLQYRRKRCRKGHPNRRALTLWRWLVQLSKAEGEKIPEELLCLAEKARFSQHTLEEKELQLLQQAVNRSIAELKRLPLSRRLWHRFGLVLY